MKHIYCLLLFLLILIIPLPVSGQSANALISEVNALRASYGLEPYVTDGSLMALAQMHSEYQASIHQSTHTRADGSGTPARSENVCGGIGVNASYCVNSMWTDDLHRYTMIGLDSGFVGAGLAESEGNSYYTLMVSGSGKETGLVSLNPVAENQIPIDPDSQLLQSDQIITCTPMPDGSIYHTVRTNETLGVIADSYNRTVAEIQALNGMEPDDTNIYIGQRLLIIYGGLPVEDTATPTITPLPPTNTPKPTSTATNTPIPLPTLTPTATMTPTPEPLIPHIRYFDTPGAKKLGLGLVVGCSLGLLLTLFFGFIKKNRNEK